MADQPQANNPQESEAMKIAREAAKIAEYKAAQAKSETELAAQLRAKLAGETPAEKTAKTALEITKEAKDLEDAQKALIDAQIAKIKAQFLPIPASADLKAPSGGVTPDATGFVEVEILGQQATREVAKLLTNDLAQLFEEVNENRNGSDKNPKVGTLIIYNPADIAALSAYSAVFQELEGFNVEFVQNLANARGKIAAAENLLNPQTESAPVGDGAAPMMDMGLTTILAAPAIATGIVKSIAELVNLFRTETEIKNKTLTVTEDFIVSCLVCNLPDVTVYYPSLYPPMLPDAGEKTKFVVVLRAVRANAHAARGEMKEIDSVIERVVAAQSALGSHPSPLQTLADLNEAKEKLNFLATTAAQVIGGLEAPDATTKTTPLVKLLGIARLHELINTAGTYTLRFTATASGATTIRKNFFGNAKVLHTAGANLVYQLFDNQGRIARANALQAYLDSKTSAEVLAMTDSGEQIKTLDSRLGNLNQIGGAKTKLLNAAKTP